MNYVTMYFQNITVSKIYLLILPVTALYLLIIAPPIFYFFVTPKIEKKYGKSLKADENYSFYSSATIIGVFPNYFMPPYEIGLYIFIKCIGLDKYVLRRPHKGTIFYQIKTINYDIKKASKLEIVMSYITAFCLISIIFSVIAFPFIK